MSGIDAFQAALDLSRRILRFALGRLVWPIGLLATGVWAIERVPDGTSDIVVAWLLMAGVALLSAIWLVVQMIRHVIGQPVGPWYRPGLFLRETIHVLRAGNGSVSTLGTSLIGML